MGGASFEDIPVGGAFGPETIEITPAVIDEYRAGIGSMGAGVAPRSDPAIIPPTLGCLFLFRSFYAAFPPPSGRLFASLELESFRPWREGSRVMVEGSVLDKYVKRGKKYLLFEVRFVGETGAEIARARAEEVTPE